MESAQDANDDMDLSKMNFDNEVLAYLSDRKEQLIVSHEEYIKMHPEIREVMNDFLSSVLLAKPVSAFRNSFSYIIFCNRRMTFLFTRKNTFIPLIPHRCEVSPLSL